MKERPQGTPVRVGQQVVVEVESLADGPDAMCRVGNYVLFVAGALPGEKVLVQVTSAARKFGRAHLLEIQRRSPDRVGPLCEHFEECGGCHFQHLAYDAQLAHKTERLKKTLSYPLHTPPDALPILPMVGPDDPWEQRNKIALHVKGRAGKVFSGLFKLRSREVVHIRECPVQDAFGTEMAFAAADSVNELGMLPWDERDDHGMVRAIVVRSTKTTRQAQVTLVARHPRVPKIDRFAADMIRAGATGVAVNVNERIGPMLMGRDTTQIEGPPRIAEEIGGVRYLSSPGAFFQTSAWGAAFLVDAVRRLVDPPPNARVVDLYSGGGLLSLALADRARVIGIEENPSAVSDAVASAKENRFTTAQFLTGPAERLIRGVAHELGNDRPWAVMLDPPREGCDPAVIHAVATVMRPQRIVYVSCDPVSLGRDLALFAQGGYALKRVEPLDMFPHAFHIEAIAVLEPVQRAPIVPPKPKPQQRGGPRTPVNARNRGRR